MSTFNGKAGYVTGAASGIGRASAIAFAAEGASVVVSDLETKRKDGEAVVRLIEKNGGKATFVAADGRKADDVLWAMTTRMQGNLDIIAVPCVSCHVLDPSQTPEYDPSLPAKGTTSKTIFDATVPFRMKDKFKRAQFRDVDPRPFAPELNLQYP